MARLTLHGYQERAVRDVIRDPYHALLMDPGLGKTAVVLTAFAELREQLDVAKMLVIAPLRVCHAVWPAEGAKWDQFQGMRFAYLGEKDALEADADVFLINPERIPQLFGKAVSPGKGKRAVWKPGPWRDWAGRPEMLVIDESSKFKRATGVRVRTVKRYLDDFGRRIALTGSPTPNGLMDLHGQMLLVDGGASLDHRVTYFRKRYFDQTIVGRGAKKFPKYEIKEGAEDHLLDAISDRVTVLRAEDWLELPEWIYTDVPVELPARVKRALDELITDSATEIDDIELIEDSPALTKVRQLTNGAVYKTTPFQEGRSWQLVHSAKLDALEELLDELGRPALIGYEFICEREEIAKRLKKKGMRLARLGGGVSGRDAAKAIEDWNSGRLDAFLVHPLAGGHGLNLQEGGNVIVWYAPIWDLELYQQLNGRLRRQGQQADKVFVYHLVGRGTPDRRVARVLRKKDATQERVFEALKREETE